MQNILAFEKAGQIIEKYGYDKAKLIPILQEIQNEYRYLPEELMVYVATMLNTTSSHVYGVASFLLPFHAEAEGQVRGEDLRRHRLPREEIHAPARRHPQAT